MTFFFPSSSSTIKVKNNSNEIKTAPSPSPSYIPRIPPFPPIPPHFKLLMSIKATCTSITAFRVLQWLSTLSMPRTTGGGCKQVAT